MARKSKLLARLVLHHVPKMTAKQRDDIARWLELMAKSVRRDPMAQRFIARYEDWIDI
jgi:hypothetical protein